MKTVLNTITAAILATTLVGCGSSSKSDTPAPTPPPASTDFSYDVKPMITNLTNNVIVEGYEDLDVKADAFLNAVQTLLESKDQASLAAAQQAWKEARVPWEQGESHIFGPVDALSIDPHLDTWPLNTVDLKALLETSAGFSAEQVKALDDGVQGFHTMEFLLFGDGVTDNVKLIAEMTEKEMQYLIACAQVFAGYSQALVDAWNKADGNTAAYKDNLLTPGNQFYASNLAVVEEIIQGMIGIVDEVGNGKIADPLGASKDKADTTKVESQYSWNSLIDFSNNIKGVKNVYLGTLSGENDSPGIKALIAAGDTELATRIEQEIDAAISAIDAISGNTNMPFRQAISDDAGRKRIQVAVTALTKLQTTLEEDVVKKLLKKWKAS